MLRTDIDRIIETVRTGFDEFGGSFDFGAVGLDRDEALFALLFSIRDELRELRERV